MKSLENDFSPNIQGFERARSYILTQSPLAEATADIWRLMNDTNSSTIIMLNQISGDQKVCLSENECHSK